MLKWLYGIRKPPPICASHKRESEQMKNQKYIDEANLLIDRERNTALHITDRWKFDYLEGIGRNRAKEDSWDGFEIPGALEVERDANVTISSLPPKGSL